MGPTYQKKQRSNILGGEVSILFGFGKYFGRNSRFEIFMITMSSKVIEKSQFMNISQNIGQTKQVRKQTTQNVAL